MAASAQRCKVLEIVGGAGGAPGAKLCKPCSVNADCIASSSPHSFNTVIASPGSCTVSQKANVTGTAEPDPMTALTVCCR